VRAEEESATEGYGGLEFCERRHSRITLVTPAGREWTRQTAIFTPPSARGRSATSTV